MRRKKPAHLSRPAYLNLVRSIGLSDFKVKYNASILGYFWTLAKPLLLFSILYVVFSKILNIGSNVPFYAIQLLLGIIVWNYFSECTVTSMNSLVSKGGLLRKIYFPREIIILASGLTSFLTMLLNLAIIPVFMIIRHVPINGRILLLVPLLAELFCFTIGLSLLLAALFVRFRDIGHIWEVTLQGLFYATPIIYSPDRVPLRFRGLFLSNPIAQIIQDIRSVMVTPTAITPSTVLHGWLVAVPYLLVVIIIFIGVRYFRNAAPSFAEDV